MANPKKTIRESKSKVGVHDSASSSVGFYVSGATETRVGFPHETKEGIELKDPHHNAELQVKVWAPDTDNGKVYLTIDQAVWVSLGGVWGKTDYSSYKLLDHNFTLAEIEMLAETLTTLLSNLKNGR